MQINGWAPSILVPTDCFMDWRDKMPFRVGPWEIALILGIILIVFGAGRLPQVGSAIGKGIRELRHAARDASEEAGPKTTENK